MGKKIYLIALMILLFSVSSFAKFWGTQVVNNGWYRDYTSWKTVYSVINNTDDNITVTRTVSQTLKVSINSSVGIKEIGASIGFEASHAITKSLSIKAIVRPNKTLDIKTRWALKVYHGLVKIWKFGRITRQVSWTAKVPDYLQYKLVTY
ncbi:hypothetical protein HNP65_000825 [Thermosipho japonicus]|uniref:Uncharacterized protein n=1 Tax=Thermosipho japonicus TaxID=90323 RepID=A0A841GJ38_9BACT|nr:hypothetical protein [Thermosipho japonicus]MBB6062387.1 hypothetical protein [Thermosipho japonicus]